MVYQYTEHILSTECKPPSVINAVCNTSTVIAMERGDNATWTCQFQAPPASNLTVIHNKTLPLPFMELTGKDNLGALCDKDPRIFYQVEVDPEHECHSLFTVRVVVCAAVETMQGDYAILWGNQTIAEGSAVSVKVENPPTVPTVGTLRGMCCR